MKKCLLLAASCIALSFGSAQAADVTYGNYDWSGPYLGIKGGGALDGDASQSGAFGTSGNYDVDGFLIGIMSGYNLQMDRLVIGIDSDYSFAGIDGGTTANACGGGCSTDIDYFGTSRLRIGYAFDRLLPYATGGLASALVDGSVNGTGGNSKLHFGFAVGGGLEYAFAQGWSARVEYLYVDLESKNHSYGGTSISNDLVDMHIVRAGVSMNVGWIWDAILGR